MTAVNASAIAMCGRWPGARSRTRDGMRRAGAWTDTPQQSAARASRLSSRSQPASPSTWTSISASLAQSMRESSCPLAQLLLGQVGVHRQGQCDEDRASGARRGSGSGLWWSRSVAPASVRCWGCRRGWRRGSPGWRRRVSGLRRVCACGWRAPGWARDDRVLRSGVPRRSGGSPAMTSWPRRRNCSAMSADSCSSMSAFTLRARAGRPARRRSHARTRLR